MSLTFSPKKLAWKKFQNYKESFNNLVQIFLWINKLFPRESMQVYFSFNLRHLLFPDIFKRITISFCGTPVKLGIDLFQAQMAKSRIDIALRKYLLWYDLNQNLIMHEYKIKLLHWLKLKKDQLLTNALIMIVFYNTLWRFSNFYPVQNCHYIIIM